MPKFLVYWKEEPTRIHADREKHVKVSLRMLEMVKADMQAGLIKDWGIAAGGGVEGGYCIWEVASEAELFTHLMKWKPEVNFEVKPVLTLDQCIEAFKKLSQK